MWRPVIRFTTNDAVGRATLDRVHFRSFAATISGPPDRIRADVAASIIELILIADDPIVESALPKTAIESWPSSGFCLPGIRSGGHGLEPTDEMTERSLVLISFDLDDPVEVIWHHHKHVVQGALKPILETPDPSYDHRTGGRQGNMIPGNRSQTADASLRDNRQTVIPG